MQLSKEECGEMLTRQSEEILAAIIPAIPSGIVCASMEIAISVLLQKTFDDMIALSEQQNYQPPLTYEFLMEQFAARFHRATKLSKQRKGLLT